MSYAVSTKPVLRTRENLQDEFSRRRSSFCSGNEIELSDGQTWILPRPPRKSNRDAVAFGPAYTDLIQAILEAEDISEQCVGELSLAIFLLDQNYCLSAPDYQRLLAPGTSDWQAAFHRIAQEHMRAAR